jgi:hypothetical protein
MLMKKIKTHRFAKEQDACRKDVERAFDMRPYSNLDGLLFDTLLMEP